MKNNLKKILTLIIIFALIVQFGIIPKSYVYATDNQYYCYLYLFNNKGECMNAYDYVRDMSGINDNTERQRYNNIKDWLANTYGRYGTNTYTRLDEVNKKDKTYSKGPTNNGVWYNPILGYYHAPDTLVDISGGPNSDHDAGYVAYSSEDNYVGTNFYLMYWIPIHTITLDQQGGNNGTAKIYEYFELHFKDGTNQIIGVTIPSKTGYIFGGYYTGPNGTGYPVISSTGGILVDPNYFTNDTTIYAKWTPITYTITYNGNNPDTSHGINVTGTMEQGTFTYDREAYTKTNTFKRNAYTFIGWNRASNGTGAHHPNPVYVLNWANTQGTNIDLYAQWRLDTRNINGQVNWDDQDNKYTSRPQNVQVTLHNDQDTVPIKAFPTTNNPVTVAEDNTYNFNGVQDRKESDNTQYNYTVTQNIVPGYQTTTDGYNITNKLITPTYQSNITYTPINSYQNKPLKNGKIKIKAQATANQTNQDKVGLHEGTVTFTIDNDITIDDTKTIIKYYEAETNTTHKIEEPNYTINGNTITVKFGKDQNGISHKNDKITIETEGTLKQIKTYTSNITLTGKLYDYRGTTQEGLNPQTDINLGEVTNTTENLEVTEELPQIPTEEGNTKLEVSVIDKKTKEPVIGATIQIKDKETGKIVDEFISDKEPYQKEKLPVGTYILEQTEAPTLRGYVKAEPLEFELEDTNELQKVQLEEDYTKVTINIVDPETKKPVIGATVVLKTEDGKEIATWTTTDKPYEIEKLPVGKYVVETIGAPYGYKAIKATIEVEETDKIQDKVIEGEREIFDIKVEKRISKIIRNGQETIVEGNDLKKVDIKDKQVNTDNIQIEYTIKVTNEGKIEGTAGKIIEHIPNGLEFIASNNKEYWKEENGKIIADGLANKTLQPGEYAELQIVLKWKNGTANFGTKINKVTIEGQTNELNYKEKDDNNEATAEIIVGLSTGERNILYIVEAVLLSQILIAVVIIIKMYKKKI